MRQRSSELEDLYAEHSKDVAKLVGLLGVQHPEAEDVTQEVWFTAYRNLGKEEHPNRRAWLFTIAHNAVKTWRRTRKRRPEWALPTNEGEALVEPRTPETEMEAKHRFQQARAFLHRAVPNEDRLTVLVLHEACGLTMKEVAEVTGISLAQAAWRLRMARTDLERAKARMTGEEQEKLRAIAAPFAGVDALLEALRTPPDVVVSDEEAARGWERLSERIALEGEGDDVASGDPPDPPARLGAPSGHMVTGMQIAGALVATFFLGAVTGAALHAFLSRDQSGTTAIVTEGRIAPVSTPEHPDPGPAPSASVAPSAARWSAPAPSWEADALLNQARGALEQHAPARALKLANDHASQFPRRATAKREEIMIRALVDLDRRDEAEARAAKLVRLVPSRRPVMEALLGHPFL